MKAFLMHRDRDFQLKQSLAKSEQAVMQDLELNVLLDAMALGDSFLFDVAKAALLSSLGDIEAIRYRQDILKDCLKNPSVVEGIYTLAVESIEREKRNYFSIFSRYPGSILHRSVEVLQMFVGMLRKLRAVADEQHDKFDSEGFKTFFGMLMRELDDAYFAEIQRRLDELKFKPGVLISAELGPGNRGVDYVLRKPNEDKQGWMKRLFSQKPAVYAFTISDRDESGARALSELRDRGINLVANALAQSTDHILSFFDLLRTELAFYVGCLNLHRRLAHQGEPVCFPVPSKASERKHAFAALTDVCLALSVQKKIVGNDAELDEKDLVIVTGANQGGKSTFLRSIGLSQLMMQCGMFVTAESFSANVCNGLFTHYKRQEDTTMSSGKFDEELGRMSDIVENLVPDSMVLFNESFAATNEREGSEISRQIVRALLDKRIKVFSVSHLYDFTRGLYDRGQANAAFLRAERQAGGARTFRVVEGEPLQTSYGEDLYKQIFRDGA